MRGGQKLNSDSDAVILLIVLDSSRMLISVPDAMLNALLLTFFSSAATVASITSETKWAGLSRATRVEAGPPL